MTSLQAIQKEVQKLRQMVEPKLEDVVTVRMWRPDGKRARARL